MEQGVGHVAPVHHLKPHIGAPVIQRTKLVFASSGAGACGSALAFAKSGFRISHIEDDCKNIAALVRWRFPHCDPSLKPSAFHFHGTKKDSYRARDLPGPVREFIQSGGRFLVLTGGEELEKRKQTVVGQLADAGVCSVAWDSLDLRDFGFPATFPVFTLVADVRGECAEGILFSEIGSGVRGGALVPNPAIVAGRLAAGGLSLISPGAPLPLADESLRLITGTASDLPVVHSLLPVEWERLAGFPDGFTLVPGSGMDSQNPDHDYRDYIHNQFIRSNGREPSMAEYLTLIRENDRMLMLRRTPPPPIFAGIAEQMGLELQRDVTG